MVSCDSQIIVTYSRRAIQKSHFKIKQLSVHILHSRHPLKLTCFMLGVNTWQNRAKNISTTLFLLASKIWQVNTNNQNKAKLLFRGHCPLHARRRFIGAMVPEAPLDHEGLDHLPVMYLISETYDDIAKLHIRQSQPRLTTVFWETLSTNNLYCQKLESLA